MARQISEQVWIEAVMVSSAPLAIGGRRGRGEVDATIARDGNEQPFIPATSLAGVLRSLHRHSLVAHKNLREIEAVLWGGIATDGRDTGGPGASLLHVDDATMEGAHIELRDGVAIDRRSGTAADHAKWVREVVAAGTRVHCSVQVDVPFAEPARQWANDFVVWLAAQLQQGVQVGAGGTRGGGTLELAAGTLQVRRLQLATRQGVLAGLRWRLLDEQPPVAEALATDLGEAQGLLEAVVHWRPLGGILVKDGRAGLGPDAIPLVTRAPGPAGKGDVVRGVIPWTSVKGVLRSHAEKLCRTALGVDAPDEPDAQRSQFDLVEFLFGTAKAPVVDGPDIPLQPGGPFGMGAVRGRDMHTVQSLSVSTWEQLIAARSDGTGDGNSGLGTVLQLAECKALGLDVAWHVAIDRWTAQPVKGALFGVLAFYRNKWEPLQISIDDRRVAGFDEQTRQAAIYLLLVCLYDLARGEIPLGYGTRRGLGSIEVDSVGLTGSLLGNVVLADLESAHVKEFAEAFQLWVKREAGDDGRE